MPFRIVRHNRRLWLAVGLSLAILAAFAWFRGRDPFQGPRVLRVAMAAGYVLAIAAMLQRAVRRPDERRGWILFSLGTFLTAAMTLFLNEFPEHDLPLPHARLLGVLLMSAGAAAFTWFGILGWFSGRHSGTENRGRLLNGLGGLFMGASLWLLFWMGGTWHDRFQGHSAHHLHVLLLGFQMAVTGGVATYLFLECPNRAMGPIGLLLVGQILVTSLFGVTSIWAGAGECNAAFSLLPGHPLVLALAAGLASPVEQCLDAGHPDLHLQEIVPFAPFLMLGPVLAMGLWREGGSVLWPAIALLAITGILIFRQILLLREVRSANRDLEARVEERTRRLHELQARQLRQVEPLLRMMVPRTVRLSVEAVGRPLVVLASRGLLEQALVNLVANARDAMPEGGEIRIRLAGPDGLPAEALVTVTDTGPGIPPEARERLFTPFFTTKPGGQGTGLGLASTKAMLEEVGGDIRLDPGPGTTFVLRFPVPAEG